MYTRVSFGSYYPENSIIHNLNPIIKIVNFLIAILLIILSKSLFVIGFLFIFVLMTMFLSRVPLKYYFETFWHLRYIYILICILCLFVGTTTSLLFVYLMKVIIVVEYLNIISYTTSPSENIYGIEKFLGLFNFVNFPVSILATKIDGLLRYFPTYMNTKNKILKSSYSRGVKKDKNMFFVTRRLTRKSIKDSRYVSELRLYSINQYRTNYRTNKVGFNDILFLSFHVLLIVVHAIEEGLL